MNEIWMLGIKMITKMFNFSVYLLKLCCVFGDQHSAWNKNDKISKFWSQAEFNFALFFVDLLSYSQIIFCMLISYCTTRSINDGESEVLDATKDSALEATDNSHDIAQESALKASDAVPHTSEGFPLETSDTLHDTATPEEIPTQM